MSAGGIRCRVAGHLYRFRAEGSTMRWECARCGAIGGHKTYSDPEQAERFAKAFDRRDADDIGRRAPLLGMFPLRIRYWLRGRVTRRGTPPRPRP